MSKLETNIKNTPLKRRQLLTEFLNKNKSYVMTSKSSTVYREVIESDIKIPRSSAFRIIKEFKDKTISNDIKRLHPGLVVQDSQ